MTDWNFCGQKTTICQPGTQILMLSTEKITTALPLQNELQHAVYFNAGGSAQQVLPLLMMAQRRRLRTMPKQERGSA